MAISLRALGREAEAQEAERRARETGRGAFRAAGLPPKPSERVDELVKHGEALVAQMQYAEAIPLLERATQLAPDSLDAWFSLGIAHNELEHWQEALPVWERVLSISPRSVAAWNHKGNVLNNLKRYEEALTAYDCALNADYAHAIRYDAAFWSNRARVLRALGREVEAQEAERQPRERPWPW
jgi:tetratricopeptide (TPR) repeat protein